MQNLDGNEETPWIAILIKKQECDAGGPKRRRRKSMSKEFRFGRDGNGRVQRFQIF